MDVPLLHGEVTELPDLYFNNLLILVHVIQLILQLCRQLVVLHCGLQRPQILVTDKEPFVT